MWQATEMVERIHQLKKINAEAEKLRRWQEDIADRIQYLKWSDISGIFPRTIAELLSDHDLARHPLTIIPNMDWAHISGLFPRTIADILSNHDLARHPLSIIPTMDDAHIPDVETLSYGDRFAVAQIPWSSGIDQNLLPDAPSTRHVGTSTTPFATVYADELHGTAYYADIIFQEKNCKICGRKFVVGDDLALKVVEVEEKGIHAVPIHRECAGERK